MVNKYRATNTITGDIIEGAASDISKKIFIEVAKVYYASEKGLMLDGKWKVELLSIMLYPCKCDICGREFDAKSPLAMYCSNICRNKAPKRGTKIKKAREKKNKDLDFLAKEAKKAGTSYGLLEAQKWANENVKIVRKW